MSEGEVHAILAQLAEAYTPVYEGFVREMLVCAPLDLHNLPGESRGDLPGRRGVEVGGLGGYRLSIGLPSPP